MRGVLVLLCLVFVEALDKNALMPNIEEARQALAQMSTSMRTMMTSQVGKVYHEVLAAEELLLKIRTKIQDDQTGDHNYTIQQQTQMTLDLSTLSQTLNNITAEFEQHNATIEAIKFNLTENALALGHVNASVSDYQQKVQQIRTDCDSLYRRHHSHATAFAADIATVSNVIGKIDSVECDKLSSFVQTLSLPSTGSSFLELSTVPCPCQSLIQSDGMSEGCHCDTNTLAANAADDVEFPCELRRENIHELMKSLLQQLYASSAQEANAFESSHAACLDDLNAQQQKLTKFIYELASLQKRQNELNDQIPEAESVSRVLQESIVATEDAISSVTQKRNSSQLSFADRFHQREMQMELVNEILQVIRELTRSQYSDQHMRLRDECPNLCSRHGICLSGYCECDRGWQGIDCNIDATSQVCPFEPHSTPCEEVSCSNVDFTNLKAHPQCAKVVCEYCRTHTTSDASCVYPPTAMFCAEQDRAHNCSSIECPVVEADCGLRRVRKSTFTGCCFNPLLDCVDKCSEVQCPAQTPECPLGKAVRYPLRDCCFNAITDCVEECALQKCSEEDPVCPVGKQVRHPFAGCCFNATVDCENECTTVVCNDEKLPIDECRRRGLRWTGSTVGCCFNADDDCASGDDAGQADERLALVSFFNSTNGNFWYKQLNTNWMTDAWICYWFGVECGGEPGAMTVTTVKLVANGLSGMLPPQLSLLRNLTHLDLSENFIEGPIPKSFGELSQLQSLKLRQNSLIGTVPTELGGLQDLEILDLGFNFLEGPLPSALHLSDSLSTSCNHNCMCHEDDCAPLRSANDDHNPTHITCPVC
eukprot:c7849_g1_i1.p1 GENE.c7849_g1_i1~~c7849_g1_i1.p1  ORF type:complete len:820 (-),score=245.59 c7849_g1_i1:158-2617(-)